MDYKYIEQLLERYWNSQTTLEEEAILKAFFCQDDIPASLLPYKPLFAYAKAEEENVLGDDFDARMEALVGEPVTVKAKVVTLRQRMMPLFKAAAVVVGIAVLVILAYVLSSGDPALNVKTQPTTQWLKLTDTMLLLTYVLGGAAIVAIIVGAVRDAINNK